MMGLSTYKVKSASTSLGISVSTVRKYCLILEEKGFKISRDENNVRIFYDADITALQEMLSRSESGAKLEVIAEDIAKKQVKVEEVKGNPPAQNDAMAIRDLTSAIEKLTDKVEDLERENEETRRAFMMALRKIETITAEQTSTIESKAEDSPVEEKRGLFSRLFKR